MSDFQFSSVQSLSLVWLLATTWTVAHKASLSITNSQSPPKPMSIESVMPSNHLILCYPLLLLPSIFPNIRVFSKESALHIRWPKYWSFTVHILLKPGLENIEHYFTSVWDECSCAVVWAFLGIAFLWDWNENWTFPVLWPLLSFPNLLSYWVQHFHSIIFQDLKEFNWNSITSTSTVHSDASYGPLDFTFQDVWL